MAKTIYLACGRDTTNGKLYVSDPENSRILQVPENGPVEIVAGVIGTPGLIAAGPNGSLYINPSDASGGVQKINSTGQSSSVSGIRNLLAVDSNGSLYFYWAGWLQKLNPDHSYVRLAGNGTLGYSGDGGLALKAQITSPDGLALGSDGSVFFSNYDPNTNRSYIRKVDTKGMITVAVAGEDYAGFQGLAMSSTETLYISDSNRNQIFAQKDNKIVHTVAGTNSLVTDDTIVYTAESAKFGKLRDVKFGPQGSIYIVDYTDSRVRKIDAGTGQITTLIGGTQIQPVPKANRLAFAPDGSFYFHFGFNDVLKFGPALSGVTTFANVGVQSCSLDSMAVARDGTVYVKCHLGSQWFPLYKLSQGGQLLPIPNNYSGEFPAGIKYMVFGPDGSLFFTDGVSQVFKMDPSGNVSIIGGSTQGFADGGWATDAKFMSPNGIAVTDDGSIYVADSGNGRIRLLQPKTKPDGTPSYLVSTIFGGESQKDCTGAIRGTVSKSSLESELRVSLSQLCQASPVALDVRSSCAKPNGTLSLAFTQDYGITSNVVQIARPCPERK